MVNFLSLFSYILPKILILNQLQQLHVTKWNDHVDMSWQETQLSVASKQTFQEGLETV